MFDDVALLEDFAGDEEILREACETYLVEMERMLDAVRAPLATQDFKTLERAAHTFKGASSNFRAEAVVAVAFALEKGARDGQLSNGHELFSDLELKARALAKGLRAFLDGPLKVSA